VLGGKDFGTRQTSVTPPPTGASISGTVFNDLDGDRVKDSNELGVANVTIYNDANNNSKLDTGELTTITDANGLYTLSSLSSGSYKIRQILQSGWSQTTPTNNYGWTITLASNQQLSGKDFGTRESNVVPPPTSGGSISGNVWNDLDGDRVKDSNELGVANITVYNDANNNSKLDSGELTAVTDGSGLYTLSNLASGSYKIRQILQSGWSQTTPTNNYGWTITLASNQQLSGKDFGTRETNVTPPPTSGGSISGNVWNDLDGDRVKDSNEAGVANVTVYNDANNNSKLDSGEKTTTTDGSGLYTFSGLTSGSYKIRQILQSGWVQTTPTNNYGWTITLGSNQQLSGKDFGTKQSNVTPSTTENASLAGFTFDDTNHNGQYDTGEKKTGGKKVFLDTNNNGQLDSGEQSTTTDSSGNWTFTHLATGAYHVRRVFPSGWTYSTTLIDIDLTEGQAITGLQIGSKAG
jgi:protocatechuate 3,4-dioxygenase beta subunit